MYVLNLTEYCQACLNYEIIYSVCIYRRVQTCIKQKCILHSVCRRCKPNSICATFSYWTKNQQKSLSPMAYTQLFYFTACIPYFGSVLFSGLNILNWFSLDGNHSYIFEYRTKTQRGTTGKTVKIANDPWAILIPQKWQVANSEKGQLTGF